MSNKNKKTNLLVLSVVAVVAMVILSVVGFVLAMTGVFAVNEFLLGFMILTAGLGIVFFVYGPSSKAATKRLRDIFFSASDSLFYSSRSNLSGTES